MATLTVDFGKSTGKVKPMHAVNNGPLSPDVRGASNSEMYKEAGIPYARNHDASFYSGYGGEHIVDVHRIFKNFDADENDPKAYIFAPTDRYVKDTLDAGTKVFYRLGASIEHNFKYGTYPPKDFGKWARICEHIIAHYNEGWADGFNYGIEYWEIWNEADCRNADGSNPCWQGTEEQFVELYSTAATYLKNRFPNIKIGGPAFMDAWRNDFKNKFFKRIKECNAPLDFYSYHRYTNTPEGMLEAVYETEAVLKDAGLDGVETILNEWNYVKGWNGDDWKKDVDAWKGIKGASFIAATMCECQYSPLDMLMFYDACPSTMCSLFETDRPWVPLKGYYPFKMFNELYKLRESFEVVKDDKSIYAAAAKCGNTAKIMLTYFDDETEIKGKDITVRLNNLGFSGKTRLKCYMLDEADDFVMTGDETLDSTEELKLRLSLYGCCLLSLEE